MPARHSALEGSLDLCRMPDVRDVAVICSILRDDAEMARIDDVGDLIARHGLAVADLSDLAARLAAAGA